MTFDEKQAELAAKGETVFAGTWCPTGEGLYLVSATTIDDLRSITGELEDELHCVRAYNDELIANLKQIEDAIAFELGGEPCGLHAAHVLIKSMIKAAQEDE